MTDYYIGWIGNAVLLTASWQLGNKKRWAFLLMFLGELLWCYESIRVEKLDMLFICVIFAFLALRNWVSWGIK